MAFGASRSVKLFLKGDSTGLERALTKAEVRLKGFERVAGKRGIANSALLGSFSKGGALVAGVGVGIVALKSITDAAKNAQVILGQTSVAVSDAGLSWDQYGKQVQSAALSISKSSAFDDEQVLQSFSTFVRGQKDVAKSLELSKLAADVARGRYTDLATATQLVNKAALGQIGALRRAGIAIDKNATATQALAALQAAYGGAAVRYANSAAGAQDKLAVSVENLKEQLGNGLLPVLTEFTKEASAGVEAAGHLADALGKVGVTSHRLGDAVKVGLLINPVSRFAIGLEKINDLLKDTKKGVFDVGAAASAFSNQFGVGALVAAGNAQSKGKNPFADVNPKVDLTNTNVEIPPALKNQELDARLSGNRNVLKGILAKEAQFLQSSVKNSLPADQAAVKEALLAVTDEIKAIDDSIIQDANDKKQALKDAKDAQKAAHQKALDALKAQAQAFKNQADDIKSAVLDAFDTKTSKINNARALDDAKRALRVARQIGGKQGIKLAQRDLTDAQRAVQRQQIEDRTFRVSEGPKGPVNALTIGNQTINIYTNDPKKAANEVLKILKGGAAGAPQQRGRVPGRGTY